MKMDGILITKPGPNFAAVRGSVSRRMKRMLPRS